ncbi:MAG TPA: Na+/H+ antiporter NhaA, partial [Tepidiformaceae bacterium]|nr:Na+/H+ antiporter NhaA [Tepidiformaceae bacterium]
MIGRAASSSDQSQPRREFLRAQLTQPVRDFLQTESGSAGLLVIATVAALAWANSPWSSHYFNLWATDISVHVGGRSLDMDLHHWINDGLMVVFFFVIGLEVRKEFAIGELVDRSRVVVPLVAGVMGMLVPAAIF